MFTERFRSHHDAEHQLSAALGMNAKGMKQDYRPALEAKLQEKPQGKPRGVYIHVPHCDRICTFCNLNRTERTGADLDAYTEYVISGITSFGKYPYIREQEFDGIYFGGGTPTVLSTEQLVRILKALRDTMSLKKNCEITVESTLHNLGVQKAVELAECGVNRFSIGVQTFSDPGRKLLGRSGTGKSAAEAVQALRESFKGVLGIDIIYSYPHQSLEELAFDAETCISTGVDSVSFYSLMIHHASALAKAIDQGELVFQRDLSFDLERHNLFYKTLKAAGFSLLELSKLARPSRDPYRYIHILYERGDMIPIGSGAGGNIGGFPLYAAGPNRLFISAPNERYDRYYRILGLLQFGIYDPDRLCLELGEQQRQAVGEQIASFAQAGLLESLDEKAWTLTAEGVFWGNNMAVALLKGAIEAETEQEVQTCTKV